MYLVTFKVSKVGQKSNQHTDQIWYQQTYLVRQDPKVLILECRQINLFGKCLQNYDGVVKVHTIYLSSQVFRSPSCASIFLPK